METKKQDDIPVSVSFNPSDYALDMATDLKLMIGFVVVTFAIMYIPVIDGTILRSASGLVTLLFIPGYSFAAALFPRKKDIDGIERAALSFGMSITIAPLIGLGLSLTPWGIHPDPIVACLAIFTLACALVANKRRHDVAEDERFSVDSVVLCRQFESEVLGVDATKLEKYLIVILAVFMLLSAALVAYVIVVPGQGEAFTEFYIRGPDGKMDHYPANFSPGDEISVIVDVANHEYRGVDYDLVIALNDSLDVTQLYAQHFTLGDNQTWEKTIRLQPDRASNNTRLEFRLYANGNMTAPDRELHLLANTQRG